MEREIETKTEALRNQEALKKTIENREAEISLLKEGLEKEKSSNTKLKQDLDLKSWDLRKQKNINQDLKKEQELKTIALQKEETRSEHLVSVEEKLLSLIEKVIEKQQVVTHEEVHQKISLSHSSFCSSHVNSSINDRLSSCESSEAIEQMPETRELAMKLERLSKILRKNLMSQFNEREKKIDSSMSESNADVFK